MTTEREVILAVGKTFPNIEAAQYWIKTQFDELPGFAEDIDDYFDEYLENHFGANSAVIDSFSGDGFYIGFNIDYTSSGEVMIKSINSGKKKWECAFRDSPEIVCEVQSY